MTEREREEMCEHEAKMQGARRRELTPMLRAHAASCARCTRALDALERIVEEARGSGAIDPARSERVRARLLDAARRAPPAPPSRRPALTAAAVLGVAALVALAMVMGRGTPADSRATHDAADAPVASVAPPSLASEGMHGTVRASAGAHFSRVSDAPDEIVRLLEGAITVSVTPLAPGERFRVIVGDAEVEVRGTAFEVSASDDRLAAVHVFHGRVEVRLEGHDAVTLVAGDRWAAPDEAAEVLRDASERTIEDGLAAQARDHASRRTRARSADESAPITDAPADAWTPALGFETGWNALGADDPAAAAAAFGELIDRAPDDALAEDASFWRGVALARAGRTADARSALDAFVHDYSRSPRANEAAVMLGWLLVDEGRPDGARAMFDRGAHDPSERLRASAERGLAATVDRSTETSP